MEVRLREDTNGTKGFLNTENTKNKDNTYVRLREATGDTDARLEVSPLC